jgi:hypothetical protein
LVNGALKMKDLYKACYGALLVVGLAGINSVPAFAGGYHWDASCHCRRPDVQYTTKHYVRAPARVVTRHHVVNRTRVVRGKTKLVQENRVTVHVRPVIHREVVVHRINTIVKDVVLHRVNRINKYRNEHYTRVVNVYVPGSVRHVTAYYNVRGCGCGGRGVVSYRD